jgi:hypothetical protein
MVGRSDDRGEGPVTGLQCDTDLLVCAPEPYGVATLRR